jgi:hypothetical protein
MNRSTLVAAFTSLIVVAGPVAAQDEDPTAPGPWQYRSLVSLNLTQSAFSGNWAGGDRGSVAWVLRSTLGAHRQFNRSFRWENTLLLAYGEKADQIEDPDRPGHNTWAKGEKNEDQIQLDSVGRFTLNRALDPYVAVRGESQFINEDDPRGSFKLDPIKISESAGVARSFLQEENREVLARLGFALRQTYAQRWTDLTGDNKERFSTNDGGIEFRTTAKYPLLGEKILYTGEVYALWSLFFSEGDALKTFDELAQQAVPGRESVQDFWKTVDVNWQNQLTAPLTSWLNVNFYFQLVYDKFDTATKVDAEFDPNDPLAAAAAIAEVEAGIRKSGQWKQTLAIGLQYQFL